MTTYLAILTALLAGGLASPSFDYASYERKSVEELLERSKSFDPDKTEGQSLLMPPKRVHLSAQLVSHPKPCDDFLPKLLLKTTGVSDPPEMGHCMQLGAQDGTKINLWVQGTIAPYVKDEYEIGDTVEVWALWLFVNSSDRKPYFIVNAIGPRDDVPVASGNGT